MMGRGKDLCRPGGCRLYAIPMSLAERKFTLPDIELLVAGHHGAKTSTSEALLEITQPETVLLSVGEGNRYGHPAAETLETIEKYGAEVYRTDVQGSLTVWR